MIYSKYYPLNPSLERRYNRFIILAHVSNFPLRSHFIEPDLRNKTSYYCFDEIEFYFRERVKIKHLPFHFYTSMIKKDWQLFTSAPLNYRSPVVSLAAENYYIEDKYRDAILVCVQDNYALTIPDDRMYQMLAANLIAPLLKEFKVNFRDSVFWWDEIFDWDRYEQDKINNPLNMVYPFEVNRMKFFDRVIFNLQCIRYT